MRRCIQLSAPLLPHKSRPSPKPRPLVRAGTDAVEVVDGADYRARMVEVDPDAARVPHPEHCARWLENGGSRATSTSSTPPVVVHLVVLPLVGVGGRILAPKSA